MTKDNAYQVLFGLIRELNISVIKTSFGNELYKHSDLGRLLAFSDV